MTRYAADTSVPADRSRAEIDHVALLAWVAGIIEGEGTITITRSGRRGYTRPHVSVTSTEPEIIGVLQSRWPGKLTTRTPKGNARTAVTWRLDARSAIARFLWDVLPYLRTERRVRLAWLVLDDIGARQQGSRDDSYLAECHARRERARHLNKRGAA